MKILFNPTSRQHTIPFASPTATRALNRSKLSGRDVLVPPAGAATPPACPYLRAAPAVVAAAAAFVAARGAVHGEGAAGADGGEADPAGARRHAHPRPHPAARGPPRGSARRRPVPLVAHHHRRRRALQRPPGQVARRSRAHKWRSACAGDAEFRCAQVCKVYVSVFGDERGKKVAIEGLKAKTKYVRSQIGKRMKLRLTPEIRFIEDESMERGSRVGYICIYFYWIRVYLFDYFCMM